MHPDTIVDPPRTNATTSLLLLILVLALGLFTWRMQHRTHKGLGESHIGVGSKLSEVAFVPLVNTEKPVKWSEIQGRVVLINIWGPWCGPCLQEFPELAALERKYRGSDDLKILLVSCDNSGNQPPEELASDTQEVLLRNRSTAPIYYDPQGKVRSAVITSARLDQFGYPTTIIVDKEGIIRGVWVGFTEYSVEEMGRMLERLSDPSRQS